MQAVETRAFGAATLDGAGRSHAGGPAGRVHVTKPACGLRGAHGWGLPLGFAAAGACLAVPAGPQDRHRGGCMMGVHCRSFFVLNCIGFCWSSQGGWIVAVNTRRTAPRSYICITHGTDHPALQNITFFLGKRIIAIQGIRSALIVEGLQVLVLLLI